MLHVHDGQCGLCTHFGEEHPQDQKLMQIRKSMEAAEDLLDTCGHPRHAPLHLKVTPMSGCDGFEPARAMA
jgi:dihydroorotate dehydrogenase